MCVGPETLWVDPLTSTGDGVGSRLLVGRIVAADNIAARSAPIQAALAIV
jgi:hypothetical protein